MRTSGCPNKPHVGGRGQNWVQDRLSAFWKVRYVVSFIVSFSTCSSATEHGARHANRGTVADGNNNWRDNNTFWGPRSHPVVYAECGAPEPTSFLPGILVIPNGWLFLVQYRGRPFSGSPQVRYPRFRVTLAVTCFDLQASTGTRTLMRRVTDWQHRFPYVEQWFDSHNNWSIIISLYLCTCETAKYLSHGMWTRED